MPNISLEQWRSLITVVETGGYAQAAEKLYKSQSAVTYAVQKIESLLALKAFEIQGRKAVLTPTGQMLYRRALALVNEANDLEAAANRLSAGWEAVIHLAAEILFPTRLLLDCLNQFGLESPHTRVELIESVLGGTSDALYKGEADLAISPNIPSGFLGDQIMTIQLIAVAQSEHPLHQLNRVLTYRDLQSHRHIVVRDSGAKRDKNTATIEVNQRWTVSNIATSIEALTMGFGFAWLPAAHIKEQLKSGQLKALPLREGGVRTLPLYLIYARPDFAGPGVRRLAEILMQAGKARESLMQENSDMA
ncbi:LysR family transcriptional regulator [Methylotenera oryzisoli]|jgi:DNA-binding transcriptional LysR family regulator|uniref:LysR family transcriptional regulator n=1 Tax=Methylotenera oryzisoli TaxID=2080758 RepID=A0A4Y9VRU2_9PROT|nr:LysR family transcriptional regulator [Methylotenera oryzisoli]TFW71582.1 LysR family transcriptional regulator [Methylotenera oryzisoli]